MILWKWIWLNDFMKKDLVKWFYDAKRFCQMILDQSYLPFIYLLVSEERENVCSVEMCV